MRPTWDNMMHAWHFAADEYVSFNEGDSSVSIVDLGARHVADLADEACGFLAPDATPDDVSDYVEALTGAVRAATARGDLTEGTDWHTEDGAMILDDVALVIRLDSQGFVHLERIGTLAACRVCFDVWERASMDDHTEG